MVKKIEEIISTFNFGQKGLTKVDERNIQNVEDVFRGFIHCFKSGIAEEWLIQNVETFDWLMEHLGYDKMQMGGQGGGYKLAVVELTFSIFASHTIITYCALKQLFRAVSCKKTLVGRVSPSCL